MKKIYRIIVLSYYRIILLSYYRMVLMKGAAKYEKEMDTAPIDIDYLGSDVLLLFAANEYTQP